MWVRGLKRFVAFLSRQGTHVAPYVGAWIETSFLQWVLCVCCVAPYVGAWIETYS